MIVSPAPHSPAPAHSVPARIDGTGVAARNTVFARRGRSTLNDQIAAWAYEGGAGGEVNRSTAD